MNKDKIMKPIIIIAVIIIPILYSFFYLKAFWDPYGNLHDMKIAIVNLDEGNEGENLGNELVDKLKEKDVMELVIMNDSDKAQEGLINQDYYATITIPKNFTSDLNNADNSNRKVTTITYSPNQKNNYLASQIINKVVTTVETELRSNISRKVVAKLTEKLNEVPDKMEDISDGATKIENGTSQLQNGLQQLSNGTNNLNSSYQKFDAGIDSAYSGSANLSNGLSALNSGADKIYAGINEMEAGTNTLPATLAKVGELNSGVNNLNTNVGTYVTKVNNILLAAKSAGMITEAELEGLQTLGNGLTLGTNNLNTEVQGFSTKAQKLGELSNGVEQLKTGMLELKQGISAASAGSNTLQSGLQQLSTNSKLIKNGTAQLNSGAAQALSGSEVLLDGTNTFKNEIDNGIQETKDQLQNIEGLDEYTASPVEVDENDYGEISSYGIGFAPYFMSISLWVGSLIMIIIFYYDPEDRFKILGRNAENKYIRSGIYFIISVIQGIVLGIILKLGLGYSVTNLGLYYGSCILTSIVFFSILQFLVIKLGDVGKFLGILILVLQLAASGGTFPIETVPKFFQAIYKFMPMNYTIRLLKESLVKVDDGMVRTNAWILIGIFIAFMAITIGVDFIKNKRDKAKD